MPPHTRQMQNDPRQDAKKISGPAQGVFSKITDDIKALNSSILIISQKINFLVRNEKILSRNLIVINKKVKEAQEGRQQGISDSSSGSARELSEINLRLSEFSEKIARLESEIENIRQNYAKSEQVSEIKYVMDSINPLEFATIKDLQEATGSSSKKGKK